MAKYTLKNEKLYRWSSDQYIQVPPEYVAYESQFYSNEYPNGLIVSPSSYTQIGGKTYCIIPNQLLQYAGKITVYAYRKSTDVIQTETKSVILCRDRDKPSTYVYTPTTVEVGTGLDDDDIDTDNIQNSLLYNGIYDTKSSDWPKYILKNTKLYRWSAGQYIKVPDEYIDCETHFYSNEYPDGLAVSPSTYTEIGNDTYCIIPNQLLQYAGKIIVYACNEDTNLVQTETKSIILCKDRPKPPTYVYTPTEVATWGGLNERISDIEDDYVKNAPSDSKVYGMKNGQWSEVENNIHALNSESTISDADEMSFHDISAASSRKITWSNIKNTLKTYFNSIYAKLNHTHTKSEITDFPTIPSKVSDLTNDSAFITNTVNNLANYYKKSETYTQAEINQLISAIPKMDIKVVDELPTTNISTESIYLLKSGEEEQNTHLEYIYVDDEWELIGSQSVDLSGYRTAAEQDVIDATKAEIPTVTLHASQITTEGNYGNYIGEYEVTEEQASILEDSNTKVVQVRAAMPIEEEGDPEYYYVYTFVKTENVLEGESPDTIAFSAPTYYYGYVGVVSGTYDIDNKLLTVTERRIDPSEIINHEIFTSTDIKYSNLKTYDIGDICTINDIENLKVYRCRKKVSTPMAFNTLYWKQITIVELLQALNDETVKFTDYATNSQSGVVKVSDSYGLYMSNSGYIILSNPSNQHIKNRTTLGNYGYGAITTQRFDYAVRCAMGDGVGEAWTAAEKAAACKRLGIAINGTVISNNADFAEVGEWYDENTNNEDRLGHFVTLKKEIEGFVIDKATSTSDVCGVVVSAPAFSGNAGGVYDSNGNLLQKYAYVALLGLVSVVDNGRCTVPGKCMPANDGTAVPSTNSMGFNVISRIDENHIEVFVRPGADMLKRIRDDIITLNQNVSGKANINHTHDDRYYTETESDEKYQTKISSTNKIDYSNISGTPTIPDKTSQLTNDSNYVTDVDTDNKVYTRKNGEWEELNLFIKQYKVVDGVLTSYYEKVQNQNNTSSFIDVGTVGNMIIM